MTPEKPNPGAESKNNKLFLTPIAYTPAIIQQVSQKRNATKLATAEM